MTAMPGWPSVEARLAIVMIRICSCMLFARTVVFSKQIATVQERFGPPSKAEFSCTKFKLVTVSLAMSVCPFSKLPGSVRALCCCYMQAAIRCPYE